MRSEAVLRADCFAIVVDAFGQRLDTVLRRAKLRQQFDAAAVIDNKIGIDGVSKGQAMLTQLARRCGCRINQR
jgi:hypothetical protein